MARTKKSLILYETEVGSPGDPDDIEFRSSIRDARKSAWQPIAWDQRSPLNRLLRPAQPSQFFDKTFGRAHRHFKSKDVDQFREWFSYEELGHVLSQRSIPLGHVVVFDRERRVVPGAELVSSHHHGMTFDPDKLTSAVFSRRGSMSIKHLHLFHRGVGALAEHFSRWIHHRIHINAYLTPAGGKTLGWHWDNHDIFILQVEGRKEWKIYEPLLDFPDEQTSHKRWLPMEHARARELETITLNKGDLLYLPVGYPHDVQADERQHSLHLTVGLEAWRWSDLLSELVAESLRDGIRDASLREPARGLLGRKPSARDRQRFTRAVEGLVTRLRAGSLDETLRCLETNKEEVLLSDVENRWKSQLGLDAVHASTRLHRTARYMKVARFSDFIQVRLPKSVICFRAKAAKALRFIEHGRPFSVGDLPGLQSLAEKKEIVVALVAAGALALMESDRAHAPSR